MTSEKKKTFLLCIVLILLLIVVLLLVLAIGKAFITVPANQGGVGFAELDIKEGMSLKEAKELLDAQGITYEVIPTSSRIANTVEQIDHTGKEQNGKIVIASHSKIKLYANEVGKDNVIYLTFDDGPTQGNTFSILDMLDERGIKATFFVLGNRITEYENRIKATIERGHIIGCHSYSHVYENIYSSTNSFLKEIEQYESALKSAIGENNFEKIEKIIRFPGGTNNYYLSRSESIAYINAVRTKGYKVYDWTALTNDKDNSYRKEGESNRDYYFRSLKETLAKSKNTGLDLILLMHDFQDCREELEFLLDYLINEGYYFGTLSHCPEYTFVE